MLKLLHTADWHLGHYLHGVSRHFEHQQFLQWLLNTLLEEHIDALIVAGDIFDSANPSAAAQAQFYDFLVQAKRQQPQLDIVLIGGNHDSASRLDAPSALLNALGVQVVGGVPRTDGIPDWQRVIVPLHNADGEIAAWCGAMPFLRHADLPPSDDDQPLLSGVKAHYADLLTAMRAKAENKHALVMTGHCYMANGALSELSERKILGGNQHALPVDIFPEDVTYVALGHLHLPQTVAGLAHIRYSGSPIPLSFDESHYPHQVLQVDISPGQAASITPHLIPRSVGLLRIPNSQSFGTVDDVLSQLAQSPFEADLPLHQQPFVELRIRLQQPEPGLRQQVEAVLANLPVRLLKISTAYSGTDHSLADTDVDQRLEELQPLAVFQRCYFTKYAETAPDSMSALFNELLETLREHA